jgi:hypothetical protein
MTDDLLSRHPLRLGHRGAPFVGLLAEPTSLSATVARIRPGSDAQIHHVRGRDPPGSSAMEGCGRRGYWMLARPTVGPLYGDSVATMATLSVRSGSLRPFNAEWFPLNDAAWANLSEQARTAAPSRQAGGHWFEPSTAHLRKPRLGGVFRCGAARAGRAIPSVERIWKSGLASMPGKMVPKRRKGTQAVARRCAN